MDKPKVSTCGKFHEASAPIPSPASSTSGSFISPSLQEKYNELDALIASQSDLFTQSQEHASGQSCLSQDDTGKGMSAIQDLQNSILQLCSERKEREQRGAMLDQKLTELDKRCEHNRQTLLEYQMEMERVGHRLQDQINYRATLQLQVQHTIGNSRAIQTHCESLKNALSQMRGVVTDLSDSSTQCVERFKSITEDKYVLLEGQISKVQSLINELAEKEREYKDLTASMNARRDSEINKHECILSKLKMESEELDSKIQNLESRFASCQSNTENIRQKNLEISQKYDEDIHHLTIERDNLNRRKASFKDALDRASQEKIRLSFSFNDLTTQAENMTKCVSSLKEKKEELQKKKESLLKKMPEAETRKKSIIENIETLRTSNSQMELDLNILRKELEESKEFNRSKIAELKKRLKDSEDNATTRKLKLNQEIAAVTTSFEAKSKICEQLKQTISDKTSELQTLTEKIESQVSLQNQLESQLTKKEVEKQDLCCELGDMKNEAITVKEKVSQLEETLNQQKESAEKEERLLLDKIAKIKGNVLAAREDLNLKKINVASLAQKLKQINEDSKTEEDSTHNQHSAEISALNERILLLEKERELVIAEKEAISARLNVDVKLLIDNLAEKDNEVLELKECEKSVLKEIEDYKNKLTDVKADIKKQGESKEDLSRSSEELDATVLESCNKQNNLNDILKAERLNLSEKTKELSDLERKIEDLGNEQVCAVAEQSSETEVLVLSVSKSRQENDSLLVKVQQLNTELEDLKKVHAVAVIDLKVSQKTLKKWDADTAACNVKIEKAKMDLETMMKSFETADEKVKLLRSEKASAIESYQKMCKKLDAAKSLRKAKEALPKNPTATKEEKTVGDTTKDFHARESALSSKTEVDDDS